MLELRDLRKSFATTRAVDGVSLTISPGEMVAIVGASGAGKTTLLRLVNRLVKSDSGSILWNGVDVTRLRGAKLRAWRRRCAMVFQHFNLAPRLDVMTNVLAGALHDYPLLPGLLKSFPRALRAQAILELDALGMAHAALQRAETLSGGQQQRVAIARAMMQRPEIILADEPVASLDRGNAALVMEALGRINRERGITVIVNLHAIDIVRRYCPRVIGMAAGKVIFDEQAHRLTDTLLDRIYGSDRADREAPALEAAE